MKVILYNFYHSQEQALFPAFDKQSTLPSFPVKFYYLDDGMAGAGAGDSFLPADFQPDRPPSHGHGQERV